MLTKKDANAWGSDICINGTYPIRMAYLDKYEVGRIAKDCWNNEMFTYGIEYGILIALAKLYDNLECDTIISKKGR